MPLGTLTAPWGIRGEIKIRLDADQGFVRTQHEQNRAPDSGEWRILPLHPLHVHVEADPGSERLCTGDPAGGVWG